MFASADQVAIATLLANKGVERSITHKLEDARDALSSKMVEILQAYKQSMTAGGAGANAQLAISDNLKMLPVLVLGLLKNVSRFLRCVVSWNVLMWNCFFRLVSGRARRSLRTSGRTRRRSSRLCRRSYSSRMSTRRSTPCTICHQRYVVSHYGVYAYPEHCL